MSLEGSSDERDAAMESADRLYNLLAYFDRRDGSALADLVRAAREGWERSGPDMQEDDAWAEFDARWARRSYEIDDVARNI